MDSIALNLQEVRERIETACRRSGRDPSEVQLIAVTKTIDTDRIHAAVAAGAKVLGENKVQEVLHKYEAVPDVSWHLIGHLQTNKVRQIIDKVELIHSVDSLHLAQEIQKRAEMQDRAVSVLVEVNVAHEESKFGLSLEAVPHFLQSLAGLDRVHVKGLMTVAPFMDDPEDVRIVFRKLKTLYDEMKGIGLPNVRMEILSMGMTNDYEVAIEEGSTMVRIGTGIFGARNYPV